MKATRRKFIKQISAGTGIASAVSSISFIARIGNNFQFRRNMKIILLPEVHF
jgi:uncharacterized membrane protein